MSLMVDRYLTVLMGFWGDLRPQEWAEASSTLSFRRVSDTRAVSCRTENFKLHWGL